MNDMTKHTGRFDRAPARNTDPMTSHDAAASVDPNMTGNQDGVLRVFVEDGYPMTDEELILTYRRMQRMFGLPQQSDSGIRTRRKELVTHGLVKDSGRKGTTVSGRASIKWVKASTSG